MQKFWYLTVFMLWIIFQFTSCITARKVNYLQKPSQTIPAYKDSVTFEDYRLKGGDRLDIKVYSMDEKTNTLFNGVNNFESGSYGGSLNSDLYTYLIKPDGTISLPMIGKVFVEGQTQREAKKTIENAIQSVIKINTVDVKLVEKYYSIISSSTSGRFPITREKINIFEALAMAGDIGTYGDRSKIRIIRETENGTQIKMFDVRSADIIHSEFYYVEPNDVIYIQDVNEQFFSVTSFPSLLATLISTFSLAIFIYDLVK
ncbi:MAG TPA: polysaccharide biosynthesis/export family protein [Paludibacteraceae bacterium]|nr:polysaccharide biosynthesis/export family protein [Paludibacteraceae bacterium]